MHMHAMGGFRSGGHFDFHKVRGDRGRDEHDHSGPGKFGGFGIGQRMMDHFDQFTRRHGEHEHRGEDDNGRRGGGDGAGSNLVSAPVLANAQQQPPIVAEQPPTLAEAPVDGAQVNAPVGTTSVQVGDRLLLRDAETGILVDPATGEAFDSNGIPIDPALLGPSVGAETNSLINPGVAPFIDPLTSLVTPAVNGQLDPEFLFVDPLSLV